jgi:type IX secretion system PorP/SprF family membrane protein
MKKIILVVIVAFSFAKTYGQQDPQYTMYMFNQLAINPGYAGSRDCLSATAHYRNQWVGIDGSPKTIGFGVHSPLNNEHVGLGFQVVNDKLGVSNTTNISGSYAYRIQVSPKGKLALGLQATVTNYTNKLTDAITTATNDNTFGKNTNLLLPNFGAGLYYSTPKAYIGATIPHLINNHLEEKSGVSGNAKAARQFRHLFLMGGLITKISEAVKFKPSVLLKYAPNSPVETDINASFLFHDALWLGATWRSDVSTLRDKLTESIDFMAAYEINNNLRIGVAYDLTISRLNTYTPGTYELMLGYDFNRKMDKMLTPRYF